VIQAQAKAVGLVAACVLWVDLGDVREYTSGPAYRKAMGLNLKERSSGQQVGQLRITKRGSSRVRRWLYFAALRWCQREPVKTWYERKRTKDGSGGRALIGIVRKLALALYQVGAKGATFDERELFPGRPRRRAASTVRSV
jgi:transposase